MSEIDKPVPKFLGKRSETIYYVNHTFFNSWKTVPTKCIFDISMYINYLKLKRVAHNIVTVPATNFEARTV